MSGSPQIMMTKSEVQRTKMKTSHAKSGKVVNIYVDQGITGTKAERPQFQKMTEDARAGCFDYIVVKNISRFARNVLISIEYIKELKALQHPVGIYFIEEGLHTLQPGKKWKTTHEDTLFSLYEQSLYFLNYLIESSNVFFTTDQKRQITTALEDFRKNREDTNIKEYVMGITIGTKD